MSQTDRFAELAAIIAQVQTTSFARSQFMLSRVMHGVEPAFVLRLAVFCADIETGEESWQKGCGYLLEEAISEAALVQRCLKAVLDFSEHEAREAFSYRGRRVFGPHPAIDLLVAHTAAVGTQAQREGGSGAHTTVPWAKRFLSQSQLERRSSYPHGPEPRTTAKESIDG